MTIAFEGADNTQKGSGVQTIVFDDITFVSEGDMLIVSITDDASGVTINPPSGDWTELHYVEESSSRLTVFYMEVVGTPPSSYTFTRDTTSTAGAIGIFTCFSKTTGDWAFVSQGGNDYTVNNDSQTVFPMASTDSTTDGMLVTCWGSDESSIVSSAPGGQTLAAYRLVSSCVGTQYYEGTSDTGITDSITWDRLSDSTVISLALYEDTGGGSTLLPIIMNEMNQFNGGSIL